MERVTPCSKCGADRIVNKRCAPCERQRQRTWKKNNRDTVNAQQRRQWAKHRGLRQKYGITRADYDLMIAGQGGRCAICALAFADKGRGKPHVDHDHASGAVRAVLCFVCNTRLAVLEDRVFVVRAEAYLAMCKGARLASSEDLWTGK